MGVMKMLFGNYSKRELKRIQPICDQVLRIASANSRIKRTFGKR